MDQKSETARPLVSVVLCAYNNWPDVEMTIESALHQSYQPLEVIVVDNSSTDVTPIEVPKRYGHLLRYARQPNRGDAGAYNAGLAIASGEFIQFVDGDDVLAPNKIEKQMEVFQTNPELDIVYGDVRQFQTAGGAATWKDVSTRPRDDMLKSFIIPGNGWTGIAALGVLFRRRALEKVGAWDESLYVADLDYWLRAAWAGCQFGYCPDAPMGFFRRRPGQMTARRAEMERGEEAVWDKALGYVTQEPYRSLIAERLAEHRFRMAISRNRMNVREALAQMTLARATSPKKITALACVFGYASIILPGGSFLVRSRHFRPVRRLLASWVRFRPSK